MGSWYKIRPKEQGKPPSLTRGVTVYSDLPSGMLSERVSL